METNYYSNRPNFGEKLASGEIRDFFFPGYTKIVLMAIMLLFSSVGLQAQSGGWDATSSNGTTGSFDYGNGVYRLISDVNTGCAGSSISETSSTYDPAGGTDFNQCYQVFFGCPGNDNIGAGTDANGDGMAFSFSKGAFSLVGNSCGGGLGYMNARADNLMITIEFDTYSSMGTAGFDANYGGGTSGNHDEIALHINGDASDAGLLEPIPGNGAITDAGNLEDGLEHTICISYDHITHILSATIDGVTKLSYDLDLKGKDLATYFGAGGLSQTWSSGKFGATNPATVSHSNLQSISSQLGGVPLCPAGVDITSPSDGASFAGCPAGPITITATANPPAGNTVNFVDFLVDGVSIGTDATANYSIVYTPTTGNHVLTAVAHWSGGTTTTSPNTNITVGSGLNLTSTVPTLDGTKEALWTSYGLTSLSKNNGATAPDLAATYTVMYDATNLYVFVDVTDDVYNTSGGLNWEKDGIEVYIDMGNNKQACCIYGADDYQYSFVYAAGNNVALGVNETYHSGTSTVGVVAKKSDRVGGYTVEMKFPWTSLGGPHTAGSFMGFDIGVNDDDNGGTRDNQLSWNDGSFGEWQDPSKFGTLQFSNCNPLPVSLLSFTGKVVNGNTSLNWITVSEKNNKEFIIERSTDLSNWKTVGDVAGAGNSTSINNYGFVDHSTPEGVVYYRIHQVDIDGASAYSNLVVVETETQAAGISIAPNPFEDVLTIKTNVKGDLDISIMDILGRVVYHSNEKAESGMLLVYPELASGAYIITVQTESLVERQRVIKSR